MEADRVVAAVRRYLVRPELEVSGLREWPDCVLFQTGHHFYEARPADWLITRAPWVGAGVRVTASPGTEHLVTTYGLLLAPDGGDLLLNDVATMRDLGRRLGDGLDPLAYAEVLAEFYSGADIAGPVVPAVAVSEDHPAGELIRDVDSFVRRYPFVDRDLVSAPVVGSDGGTVTIDFWSCHYRLTAISGALDVLRWSVRGGADRPAAWSREYVAERIERR